MVGTIFFAVAVGFGAWHMLPWVGVSISLPYCLLSGALIPPADQIAVMGILEWAGAANNLELVNAGEHPFNDGVGVVAFSLLPELASGSSAPTPGRLAATGLSLAERFGPGTHLRRPARRHLVGPGAVVAGRATRPPGEL